MANTTITHALAAREAAAILVEEAPFLANTNKDRVDEFATSTHEYKAGETVKVRVPPTGVVYDGAQFAGGGTAPDHTEKFVNLTLLPQKHVPIAFTMRERTLDMTDFRERVLRPNMRTLASYVEADLLARATQLVPNHVGTVGAVPTTMKTYAQAREKLQNFLAPEAERSMVFSSTANTELVDASKALFNAKSQIEMGFLRGRLGEAQGAEFFEHQSVYVHTNGTQASWTVNGAGQSGSTLNIGGLTAANTIKKGTVFTIAGVNAVHPLTGTPYSTLQQFVVTADFTAAGATGSISIFPEIQASATIQNRTVSAAPAAAAACTMVGGAGAVMRQNLMWHKDAFAIAVVPLMASQAGAEGSTATLPKAGVSVRVQTQYDINLDREITRVDVMYGICAVRGLHACRVTE